LISETGERSVDLVAPFSAVIETQQPFDEVQVIAGVDGAERLFHVTASPILGDSGDVVRVVQTAREVTELVRLQRASEEQSQRFRQIVDAVHGIITIKGLDGRYQLVNPRAERFFGMTGDDMIGRTASELFSAPNAAIIKANDEKMFEAGTYQTSEETLALDGGERTLMSERFPLRDYRGQVVALCCVARDMTRTRQLQQELVQSERLAAMGKLAAGVAHEINNPLTGILTFAEDLKLEAEVDDPRRADYEVIINETLRCRRIVRDLLDYSRQTAPERQQTPVGPVIQRMLAMIERQATFHNIRFKVDVETGLPEVYIDPRQIQQALLNLVINARDAMDGVGELQICARPHAEEGWIAIEVVDHGCGIESEHLDDIFQPFFSTKGGQGNGLGLPAVLSLAEQHGGRVEVQSEVGVGSTFSILLPAAGVPSRESLHGK
jgi:PAS domain S-box-containing protein